MVKTIVRSSYPKLFFSRKERAHILHAIRRAEKETSGEIRIHVVRETHEDIIKSAENKFAQLGMHKTHERNAVLIYLVIKNRNFAVWGDLGIHEKMPETFWDDVAGVMTPYFIEDRFAEGICEAVKEIGLQMKKYFPHHNNDKNELSDKISYSIS